MFLCSYKQFERDDGSNVNPEAPFDVVDGYLFGTSDLVPCLSADVGRPEVYHDVN